jgi:hypothetical protein
MGQISNLRKPTVFVLNPTTELIVAAATKPDALTFGQVGIHRADTLAGIGAAAVPSTTPVIVIHQDLGDTRFGTIRTPNIHAQLIRGWHAMADTAPVPQITYLGYDEVVGTKTLTAYVNQPIVITINIWNNDLMRWYGPNGYTTRIVPEPTLCIPCQADCTLMDPDALADWIVAYINGTNQPVGGFPTQLELKNYLTAVKVFTGTIGNADRRVGVKITAITYTPELINLGDPQQFYKSNLTTFSVGTPANCPPFPVTTTQKAKQGNGYPLEVTDLEKESQGYDRVRDAFEYAKYMVKNYIIRAVNGTKYDFYYLEYERAHRSSRVDTDVKDPYIVIFAVPAGTGAALETAINGYVAPLGFAAVTIAASTGKGTAPDIINA